MHHAPKSGMHHPSPEPSDVSVGGLTYETAVSRELDSLVTLRACMHA